MTKYPWIGLAAAISFLAIPAAASAQNIKQNKGEWSISVCQKNAQKNGFGSGASYCATKAEEQRKKGRKITP